MAFHLAVFTSSILNGAVLLQVTQLADPVIAASNNGFLIPPGLQNMAMVMGVGTNLTRFQLKSNKIDQMFPWDFEAVNVGTVFEAPPRVHDFHLSPYPLNVDDELDAYCVQSNAGAQQEYIGLILSDGPMRSVSGMIQTVHATSTTALTANKFTSCTLTLDNPLGGGIYSLVGLRAFSASGLFARVLPRSGPTNRAGGIMVQARDGMTIPEQRYGGWGEWTRFSNTAIPAVECLASAADAAEEFYLDLIKVG